MKTIKTFFADFETNAKCVSKNSSNVNLWSLVSGDEIYHGVDLDNFMKKILENKNATIYFHNLSFDGVFILFWLTSNGFEISNHYQKKSENSVEILADGKIFYQIKIKTAKSKITILCTYRLFSISVKKLGDIVGIKKLKGYNWFNKFGLIKDIKLKNWKKKNNTYNKKGEKINYYSNLKQFYKIIQQQGFHLNNDFNYDKNCQCYKCYCVTDALIVQKYFHIFTSQNLKLGITTASTAKKTMMDFLIKSKDKDNNKLDLKFIYLKIFGDKIFKISSWRKYQNSFYGGFTSYNHEKLKHNHFLENIDGYSYDVNSMYPAVMRSKLAIGDIRLTPEYYINKGYSFTELKMIIAWKIVVKPGKPAIWPANSKVSGQLNISKDYNRIPYNERRIYKYEGKPVIFLFWKEEWEYIKKCYNYEGSESVSGYVQTTDAFSHYVNKFYTLKSEAKNESERLVYKLLLNASYGKLGQKIERNEHVYIDLKKQFDWSKLEKGDKNFNKQIAEKTKNLIIKLTNLYTLNPEKYYDEIKKRRDLTFYDFSKTIVRILIHVKIRDDVKEHGIKKLSSICSASYITMLARLELYKVIIPNFKKFIYSDTDSVYFSAPPAHLMTDNKKLGYWKPEKRFSKMKVLRPKVYTIEQTHKWDGLKWVEDYIPFGSHKTTAISGHKMGESQVITPENFERGIENPKLQNQAKIVRGGIIIDEVIKKL